MILRFPAPSWAFILLLIACFSFGPAIVMAQDAAETDDAYVNHENQDDPDEVEETEDDRYEVDEDQDDTADIDTESTVDTAADVTGLVISGDFRPLFNYRDVDNRDGSTVSDSAGRSRIRIKGAYGIADSVQLGARVAWRCTTDDCSPEWYWDRAIPGANGLQDGQATFDELYVHIFRRERFNFTVGRQQTRFVLRGGVFARSLDRNDSNNTNVTWTDGLHATFRRQQGWATHFIIQRNTEGRRLRTGIEIGYAPERPSPTGAGLDTEVDGLAWNVVASLMDFVPRHNIGVNYGRTGAGWLLSPQFRENEEVFEIRYQWRPRRFPAIDARIRWREEIERLSGTLQKRNAFDAFLRLTWQFGQ